MQEFRPAILYMEQMLRIYPKEITSRWRMLPAFEESLMRVEESRSQEEQKWARFDNHNFLVIPKIKPTLFNQLNGETQ